MSFGAGDATYPYPVSSSIIVTLSNAIISVKGVVVGTGRL